MQDLHGGSVLSLYSWKSGPFTYRRRPTRAVWVGKVGVGGNNPIRVQSMTTPSTQDTRGSVQQIIRMVDAGCEIVRLTVPTTADAENIPNIRAGLRTAGIDVPLVADIHFTPAAAMLAADYVEKVRINPGNYADRKKFAIREYTDEQYSGELQRIQEAFTPLVLKCRERDVSMRIGTNHGSLSDRILNRFGDTPKGMVESALEFVRICEELDYRDLILSMKASNPVVVLEAYRLLVDAMDDEGMDYPLHLGVTEAGDGEDARIKSAIGIGALLEEGIGDTIRVSLTEDPVKEIPVALAMAAPFNRLDPDAETGSPVSLPARLDLTQAAPRRPGARNNGHVPVEVPLPVGREMETLPGLVAAATEDMPLEWVSITGGGDLTDLRAVLDENAPNARLSVQVDSERLAAMHPTELVEMLAHADSASSTAVALAAAASEAGVGDVSVTLSPTCLPSPLPAIRLLAGRLDQAGLDTGIVLLDRPLDRNADPRLGPGSSLGGLLCEGIGDSIQIALHDPVESHSRAFDILQAARVRITRTDFISCPSCGRTLFDLEETTARIKDRTSHLKGLKIAIMGCIVNGPGEMADADFGYVGWGEDKIALFVGMEMVEKDIPTSEADDRLVELIKSHDKWVEPA
jgi:(E)-4-hydroxy-3-methylbut-2-enyl-diphosphate synthase